MRSIPEVLDDIEGGKRARDLESSSLEFKQEAPNVKTSLEMLADAVVCMANADGGSIVLGVNDKASGPEAIIGVSTLDLRAIVNGVFDRTKPALSIPVIPHRRHDKDLFELVVPAGATIYSNAKGTATRRVNDECRPFPPAEQRQVLAARGLHDWSALPSSITRVDEVEIARLRTLLREAGQSDLASRDIPTMLTDLRLMTEDGTLTNAGLLLVGQETDLARAIPTHDFSYQFRTSTGAEASGRQRGREPLMRAIDRSLSAVENRVTISPLNVSGGVQVRREDYPADAVRELIVNAFVHRDFEQAGSVDIEHTPEVLTVSNPGGLVHGVTPENILSHPSTPRNRLLLETVTLLQVAERTGQGVDRTYRALLRSGKKPPIYVDTGSNVSVLIAGGTGNSSFTRYVRTVLDDAMSSDIEVLLALDYLCTKKRVSGEVLAVLIQRSAADAQRVLSRMAQADLVVPTRRSAATASPVYELTSHSLTGLGLAVEYHRRVAGGGDDKAIEHLREYGFITNQTIRRLYDVEIYAARDILQDLARRELITKLEGPKRGPSVRYGPGDSFPEA